MILAIDNLPDLSVILENAPNGVHRNHIVMSGVPYYTDSLNKGTGFVLYCNWSKGDTDIPIGIAVFGDILRSKTAHKCPTSKWAVVEGHLTLVKDKGEIIPIVIAESIEFS